MVFAVNCEVSPGLCLAFATMFPQLAIRIHQEPQTSHCIFRSSHDYIMLRSMA